LNKPCRGWTSISGYLTEDEDLALYVPVDGVRVVDEVPQDLGVVGCGHNEGLLGPVVEDQLVGELAVLQWALAAPVGVDVGDLPDLDGRLGLPFLAVLLAHVRAPPYLRCPTAVFVPSFAINKPARQRGTHDKCAVTPTWRQAAGIVIGPMRSYHKQTGVKYAQFSLVGASNTLVDVGAFNLCLLLWSTHSPGLLVAYNVASLVLANANSYLWNTLWTFRDQARHDAKQVGMFTAQGLLNAGVGSLLLWLVAHGLGAHTDLSSLVSGNVAKVVSMVIASTMSFLFLRLFVFRPKEA
jgi:putative flippase GtrA